MGDEPDLDPEINKDFFESILLQLDPGLLTEAGMKCLERFFKTVNIKVEFKMFHIQDKGIKDGKQRHTFIFPNFVH